MKNLFSLKVKKQRKKLWTNFIIIKSITTFLVYVSWLKKNLSLFFFFFLLSHIFSLYFTNATTLCSLLLGYLLKGGNPCSLLISYISSKATTLCFIFLCYILEGSNSLLSPPWLLPTKNPFFLSWFHTLFSSLHREDP